LHFFRFVCYNSWLDASILEREISLEGTQSYAPGPLTSLWTTVKAYVEVTKLRLVFLLAFTSVGTMVVAVAGQPVSTGLVVRALLAIIAGTAGANTVTCYIDRDIDAVMERTQRRPIPSGRIYPPERALYWGLFLSATSLGLALSINFLSFLAILLGLLDNILVYSLLTKRHSPLNIIWGSFSGGLPAVFGWTAVTGRVDWVPILVGTIVVLWTPTHIWNLAIYYSEDYRQARVPMLPAVYRLQATLHCIAATVVLMVAFSLILHFVGRFGPVYFWTALVVGVLLAAANLYLAWRPSRKLAWRLFKLSSPYLFILILAMMVDVWVR
jgi:protoheme IX farnesyltransferase